ncbi:hypothetical protein D3C79_615260 [compost metagenome]
MLATLEPGRDRQVIQCHRLALGIGAAQLRGIEADHRLLQPALAPVNPELTTGAQGLGLPLAEQAWRQPTRPVALRQAQVSLCLTIAPGLGRYPAAQVQCQRLAIRQGRTQVQRLA